MKIGKIKDLTDMVVFVAPPVITLSSILFGVIDAIDGDWHYVKMAFSSAAGWGIVWLNYRKIWGH